MPAVRDNPQRHRFEMETDAGVAFASYRRDGNTLTIYHTEVPRAAGGHGLGSQLVSGALDLVRAQGDKVIATCPFVRAFLQRHPDYADVMK